MLPVNFVSQRFRMCPSCPETQGLTEPVRPSACKKASQSSPPQRRKKSESFSAGACTWQKIHLRPQIQAVEKTAQPKISEGGDV
jgi:hypothetical protein